MYIYVCICVYMYICIYVYMYICLYVYVYIYVYICICTYIYIHTDIIQADSFKPACTQMSGGIDPSCLDVRHSWYMVNKHV